MAFYPIFDWMAPPSYMGYSPSYSSDQALPLLISIIHTVFVSRFVERSVDDNVNKDKEVPSIMLEEFISKVTHPRHYSQLGSLAPMHPCRGEQCLLCGASQWAYWQEQGLQHPDYQARGTRYLEAFGELAEMTQRKSLPIDVKIIDFLMVGWGFDECQWKCRGGLLRWDFFCYTK